MTTLIKLLIAITLFCLSWGCGKFELKQEVYYQKATDKYFRSGWVEDGGALRYKDEIDTIPATPEGYMIKTFILRDERTDYCNQITTSPDSLEFYERKEMDRAKEILKHIK